MGAAAYDLSGKTAVVTGAAKGIGRSIAMKLRISGAKVWGWDVIPGAVEDVDILEVDVTDAQKIDHAIAQATAGDRTIDILVNNAGYLGELVSVEKLSVEDWNKVFAVNATSVFEVSRKVIPVMKPGGWGRIVNMASVAGKEGF